MRVIDLSSEPTGPWSKIHQDGGCLSLVDKHTRKEVNEMVKNILVAVDGSEHSKKTLGLAADIASKNDAMVHVLYVISEVPITQELYNYAKIEFPNESPDWVSTNLTAGQVLQGAETELRMRGVTKYQSEVARGDPAQKILEFARLNSVDLIFIGSHGHGKVSGLLLGSVAYKVNHLAGCTCVTVR
jgi:nucleotide-binding universal stress UspA family protein